MWRTYLLLLLSLAVAALCRAQDTSYTESFPYKLGIRAYTGQKLLFLGYDDDNGTERDYMPNSPVNFGFGLSIYNTIIGFDLGYGFRFLDEEEYGKTKSFDFQLHHYSRRFAVDLYIQRYTGFYEEARKEITLHPGMRVRRYSVHGHYVFNHKRFSYKAAFTQTERQTRSAGSWLLGAEYSRTKINAEEALTNEGYKTSDNYQIGINGGYAYTWALGKYWNLGIAATVGLALGNEAFEESGKSGSVMAYPVVSPRMAAVYDRSRWALALTYVGSMLFLPTENEGHLNVHSGSVKLAFIVRFGKK